MTTTPARITTLALAAILATAACSSTREESSEPAGTPTVEATTPDDEEAPQGEATDEAAVEETPEGEGASVAEEPEPVVPSMEVEIDGTTYTGTEDAPLKIGDDTPGQPPAIEADFPDANSIPGAEFFAAGEAIHDEKYLVLVAPRGDRTGWSWAVYTHNQWGTYRAMSSVGSSDGLPPFESKQAAIDAPKTLDGRELDRAEYVLAVRN